MAQKTSKNVMELGNKAQKKIIQQYELIRQSGLTNMFNWTNVRYIAKKIGHTELYNFIKDMESYSSILRNFSTLMKKFDIKQN